MADKYTELITKVNKAINPIENGEIIVAKVAHAVEAERAENAINSGSATHADSANSAGSASFATAVVNMNLTLAISDTVTKSVATECFLEEGVYLVVYQCDYTSSVYKYIHNPCGVLVVKTDVPSLCRIAQGNNYTSGASLRYNPADGRILLLYRKELSGGGHYESFPDEHIGTLYFYKIGTLEQEES